MTLRLNQIGFHLQLKATFEYQAIWVGSRPADKKVSET